MRSYGPRTDPETGATHMRVSQAQEYQVTAVLRERRIGNGTLRFEQLRATSGAGQRIVQLRATYTDGDELVQRIVHCRSELEEAQAHAQLEADMLAAQARSSTPEAPRERPGSAPGQPPGS